MMMHHHHGGGGVRPGGMLMHIPYSSSSPMVISGGGAVNGLAYISGGGAGPSSAFPLPLGGGVVGGGFNDPMGRHHPHLHQPQGPPRFMGNPINLRSMSLGNMIQTPIGGLTGAIVPGGGVGGGTMIPAANHGGGGFAMGLPLMHPHDLEPEELDHLCHFGGSGHRGLVFSDGGDHPTMAGTGSHHHHHHHGAGGGGGGIVDSIDRELGLDDHADFEMLMAMRALRGSGTNEVGGGGGAAAAAAAAETAAAAASIDIFGCRAQVQLGGEGGGMGGGVVGSSGLANGGKASAAPGSEATKTADGSTTGDQAGSGTTGGAGSGGASAIASAYASMKGGVLHRRLSGQDQPHASSSAGSPSDLHVSHAVFGSSAGLGGGLAAAGGGAAGLSGFGHLNLHPRGGPGAGGIGAENRMSSGGGAYAALYAPSSPFDYAINLSDEPVGQQQHPLSL